MPSGLEALAAAYAPRKVRAPEDALVEAINTPSKASAIPEQEDAVLPEADLDNPSALESVLRTAGLGGFGVRNLLKGNVEGTARNVADLVTSPIRALLPGDQSSWELSRKEDLPEFSDVIGGMEPGLAKTTVDVLGGVVTDPLSFIGVGAAGAIGKGAAGAAKGASAATKGGKVSLGLGVPFMKPLVEIPGSAKALEAIGTGVKAITPPVVSDAAKSAGFALRKTFAALRPSEKVAADVAAGEGLGQATRQAAQTYPVAAFQGVDPEVQRRAVEVIRGVTSELPGPGGYADLGVAGQKFVSQGEQRMLINRRIAAMPWDDATKEAVREQAFRASDYAADLWRQGVRDKVFSHPPDVPLNKTPADYFPGVYDLEQQVGAMPDVARAGQPSLITAKTLTTPSELAEHLTREGGRLDTDIPRILGEYGEGLGRATQRAEIGRRTVGEGFRALSDEGSRSAMTKAIEGLRAAGDQDSAHVLETAFNGLPPMGSVMRVLSKLNRPFKSAATAGVVVPNLNFTVGNTVSSVVQMLQNPEARGVAGRAAVALPRVIAGSIGDGLKRLGIKAIPESEYDQVINAARASGGRRERMLELIQDPTLRSAVQQGVLDGGFVSAEELGTRLATQGKPTPSNIAYWTQDIAKGSEQRMRYGMFKDLLEGGKSPEEAARIVSETLFDYKYTSVANRALRQAIPFGMYSFKAIPQSAKFLAEKPAAAAGLRGLYAQGDANERPLPPWTQGNINIPIGTGETGNPQYLTSLRLPFETLAQIPNPSGDLGDILAQTRSDIVGQASPLIKTGIAAFGGNDPRTGQPFRSYDKAPAALQAIGVPERSEFGRAYNTLVGTGAIQPLAAPIATLSKLLDKRQSIPVAALNTLTGFKILDVDEQMALKQVIEDAIRRDPSIQSGANYYQLEKTPEGQALLQKLQEVRQTLKTKRQAAGT